MNMNIVRELLSTYFGILDENIEAKYIICKHTSVSFNKTDSNEKLWKKHDNALKNKKVYQIVENGKI